MLLRLRRGRSAVCIDRRGPCVSLRTFIVVANAAAVHRGLGRPQSTQRSLIHPLRVDSGRWVSLPAVNQPLTHDSDAGRARPPPMPGSAKRAPRVLTCRLGAPLRLLILTAFVSRVRRSGSGNRQPTRHDRQQANRDRRDLHRREADDHHDRATAEQGERQGRFAIPKPHNPEDTVAQSRRRPPSVVVSTHLAGTVSRPPRLDYGVLRHWSRGFRWGYDRPTRLPRAVRGRQAHKRRSEMGKLRGVGLVVLVLGCTMP